MSTIRDWSFREFQRVLRNNGYTPVRCNGDHWKYKSPDGKTLVINPKCNKMVVRRLIKEHGLTV